MVVVALLHIPNLALGNVKLLAGATAFSLSKYPFFQKKTLKSFTNFNKVSAISEDSSVVNN